VLEGCGLNKNNLDDAGIFWRLKKNKLESTRWFTKKKRRVPKSFPLFAKKARASWYMELEKFVYTKTHLANNTVYFFRFLKRHTSD